MESLFDSLFEQSDAIRYIAVRQDGTLTTASRPSLANASASESDRYEELFVNPTLLALVTQRGNLDCGGLRFVLIRYGNFFQYVSPYAGGHISVAIEPGADPLQVGAVIRAELEGGAVSS